jgi:hypothetical protein
MPHHFSVQRFTYLPKLLVFVWPILAKKGHETLFLTSYVGQVLPMLLRKCAGRITSLHPVPRRKNLATLALTQPWVASARVHCWAGSAVISTAGVACEAELSRFSERPRLWCSRSRPCPANYFDSIKVDCRSLRRWEHTRNEMRARPHRSFSYMDKRRKLAATLINFPKNGG